MEVLQFDVTLKRLSMTALLSQIYEHPDIKKKLKSTIHSENHGTPFAFPSTSIKKNLIQLASQKIKTLDLPESLKRELQGISIIFANKIAIWSDFVINMLELDISYLDKIYFTRFGTINDGKIFDSYWQNHKTFFKILKTRRDESSRAFASRMACQFANQEVILACQSAIMKDVQKHLGKVKLPDIKDKIDQLIGYYLCHVYGEMFDMEQGKDVYERFRLTGNINVNEVIFLAEGNPDAIRFLWNFLSDADKKKNLLPLANMNLNGGLDCARMSFAFDDPTINQIEMIEISKCSETVMFLINQMSSVQRQAFLKNNICGLMELFLMVWPYPEICKKILDEKWMCDHIVEKNKGGSILKVLLFRLLKDLAFTKNVCGTCNYPSAFYKLLSKILSLVPKEVKEAAFLKSAYSNFGKKFPNVICYLFDVFDLNALCIVINDDDLKHKRDEMIKMGSKKISELIKLDKADEMLQFLIKVFTSDVERKEFAKHWNLI